MADQRFDRRRVLKGAAAFGAVGALAAVQGPPIARADAMTGIEGTWLATVTTGGSGAPPPFQALVTFTAGGGLVETDQSTPPSQRSAGQGAWACTDDDRVCARFHAFLFDASGHPQGTLIVRFTVRLSEDGGPSPAPAPSRWSISRARWSTRAVLPCKGGASPSPQRGEARGRSPGRVLRYLPTRCDPRAPVGPSTGGDA
jgi:hypothetical protein